MILYDLITFKYQHVPPLLSIPMPALMPKLRRVCTQASTCQRLNVAKGTVGDGSPIPHQGH